MSSKSSAQQNWLRVRMLLAIGALLVVLAYSAYFSKPIIAQDGPLERSAAGDLQCISYCSTARPGSALIELSLRVADHPLNAADLRLKMQQQALDVTVYNEGFERGLYATVSTLKAKAMFRARTRGDGLAPAVQRPAGIPGLEKVVITDLASRLDNRAESFFLMHRGFQMQSSGTASEPEWVTVRVEGVESGMNYIFRLRGGGSVVTCHAEDCPVDMIPGPATRTNVIPKPAAKLIKNSRGEK